MRSLLSQIEEKVEWSLIFSLFLLFLLILLIGRALAAEAKEVTVQTIVRETVGGSYTLEAGTEAGILEGDRGVIFYEVETPRGKKRIKIARIVVIRSDKGEAVAVREGPATSQVLPGHHALIIPNHEVIPFGITYEVYPASGSLTKGESMKFRIMRRGNPSKVAVISGGWEVEGGIGEISNVGLFQALSSGKGKIIYRTGRYILEAPLEVREDPLAGQPTLSIPAVTAEPSHLIEALPPAATMLTPLQPQGNFHSAPVVSGRRSPASKGEASSSGDFTLFPFEDVVLMEGSQVQFTASAQNLPFSYAPQPGSGHGLLQVSWGFAGSCGKIDGRGNFTALHEGEGAVVAEYGGARKAVKVRVVKAP